MLMSGERILSIGNIKYECKHVPGMCGKDEESSMGRWTRGDRGDELKYPLAEFLLSLYISPFL